MNPAQSDTEARVLLLDIEGTTTSADFVFQVLFPFARGNLKDFIGETLSSDELRAEIHLLRREHRQDAEAGLNPTSWDEQSDDSLIDSLVAYLGWLMERDRKSTPLKSIQGRIWEAGYLAGRLKGHVYSDVLPAFDRWRRRRKTICIFSSGSALAQRLLFQYSTAGDLTPYIERYFDTRIGSKKESQSYGRIAAELGCNPPDMLFISDVREELDAARQAGMKTALCVREQTEPVTLAHWVIRTFDEVFP